jgi:hypothetical protein
MCISTSLGPGDGTGRSSKVTRQLPWSRAARIIFAVIPASSAPADNLRGGSLARPRVKQTSSAGGTIRLPGGEDVATQTSPASAVEPIQAGDPQVDGEPTVTADNLHQIVRALGLVEIPEHLMPKVLEAVRSHRQSMRKFDAAGIDVSGVITAQPFRA